jgi:uncharacterized membrane protein
MKKLATYFLRGSIALVPLAVTIYILVQVFLIVDRLLPIGVPGAGFVVALSLVILVGFLTSNVIGRSVLGIPDAIFRRVPLVKLLYTSIKDLVGAFVGDRRRFNHPVSIAIGDSSGFRMLGFVTRDELAALGFAGSVAVYVPQSYNVAGNLLVVPRERVVPLSVGSAELMTFIVSGGVSGFGVGQSLPASENTVPPPPVSHP